MDENILTEITGDYSEIVGTLLADKRWYKLMEEKDIDIPDEAINLRIAIWSMDHRANKTFEEQTGYSATDVIDAIKSLEEPLKLMHFDDPRQFKLDRLLKIIEGADVAEIYTDTFSVNPAKALRSEEFAAIRKMIFEKLG